MVRTLKYILFYLLIQSCRINTSEEIKPTPLNAEYLNLNEDTSIFLVYGKNPFLIIDTFYWVKTIDDSKKTNSRKIGYNIFNKRFSELRNYIIEPSILKSSSSVNGQYFLPVYNSLFLNDSTGQIYSEIDPTGKYWRQYSSKLTYTSTQYYSGLCVWSRLDYTDKLNDSISCTTVCDEFYGYGVGLVKLVSFKKYFKYGKLYSDSVEYHYKRNIK